MPRYNRPRIPLRVTAHANRTGVRTASPMSSELHLTEGSELSGLGEGRRYVLFPGLQEGRVLRGEGV
jgi:hypothetical protein